MSRSADFTCNISEFEGIGFRSVRISRKGILKDLRNFFFFCRLDRASFNHAIYFLENYVLTLLDSVSHLKMQSLQPRGYVIRRREIGR